MQKLLKKGEYKHAWTAEEIGKEVNDWGRSYRLDWGVARDKKEKESKELDKVM